VITRTFPDAVIRQTIPTRRPSRVGPTTSYLPSRGQLRRTLPARMTCSTS